MTAAPMATRMTANQIDRDLKLLARDAQDVADMAARFAADPERGLALGRAEEIAQQAQSLLLRATKVTAMQETAKLFTEELTATGGQA